MNKVMLSRLRTHAMLDAIEDPFVTCDYWRYVCLEGHTIPSHLRHTDEWEEDKDLMSLRDKLIVYLNDNKICEEVVTADNFNAGHFNALLDKWRRLLHKGEERLTLPFTISGDDLFRIYIMGV